MAFEGEPKFEKPAEEQKPKEKEEKPEAVEEPEDKERKDWEGEKEKEVRESAEEKYRKRLEGKEPGRTWKEVDEMLREKGITPGSREARDFMEKWDWGQAEKEWREKKEEKWEKAGGTIGREKIRKAERELAEERKVKEGAKAEVPTTPEGKPEEKAEKVAVEYDTTRPERELRRELNLHDQIFAKMQDLTKEGKGSGKALKIGENELREYFLLMPKEEIESYPSDLKEIQRRLKLDTNTFASLFQQSLEVRVKSELPEAIRERINKLGEAKNIEVFYKNVTDKKGKLRVGEIKDVIVGEIAKIIAGKEKEAVEKLKETLRRQYELTKEYSKYRRTSERLEQEDKILGEALSARELEPLKTQLRTSFEVEEALKTQIPEEVAKKKTGGLMKWIGGQKLRLKKTLRERLV